MSRRRRFLWWRRAFLGAYFLLLIWASAGNVTGHVPSWLALRIAYGAHTDWAASWQTYTNTHLRAEHSKYRVTSTRCVFHAGVYICSYRVTGYKAVHCMTALVDPTGLPVVDPKGQPYVHRVPCGEVMPSTKTAA